MSYILRVFYSNQFKDRNLEGIKKLTIGSGLKSTFRINSNSLNKKHINLKCKKGVWTLTASGEVLYNGEPVKKAELEDNQTFILSKTEKIAVSIFEDTGLSKEKIKLDSVDELTIGRDAKSNIVFSNKRVSNNHAKIYKIGNEYHISDIGSTNGTYVNNKLIRDVILKENDEIVIGRYTLIFTGKELLFKNVGRDLLIHNIRKSERNLKEIPMFKRSPRLKLDTPSGDIEIQAAPSIGDKPEINWLTVLLPGFGMVGIMAAIMFLTGGSKMTIAMTGPMAIIGIVVSVTTYRSQLKKYKKQNVLRIEKYTEYINSIVEDIKSNINEQLKALTLSDPETGVCFNIARDIERRLWERKPHDADFGSFRLGSGDTDFCMNIKIPNNGFTLETDQFTDLPKQIYDKYSRIHGIPVNYDSMNNPTCGIIGERETRNTLIRNIIVQAATHHCYDELKIVTIYNQEDADVFDWVRWLPHSFDNDKEMRFMANSPATANELFKYFDDIFKQRERELKENNAYRIKSVKLPYYLFIVASPSLVDGHQIMKYLTMNNSSMGVAAVFDFGDMSLLPGQCSVIAEVKGGRGCLYDKNNIASKTDFVADDTGGLDFEQFARNLAPVKVPIKGAGSSLPSCITFLEGYGVKTPNQIPIEKNWAESLTYKSLGVPIGIKTSGEKFLFDIHEKMHGPHGLVAGTTGSGKSEMVQSWILSMALHFSPKDVVFVLIDFKGTGLILPFMNLPHLAGTISDLDRNIKRNLIALENELSRRKEMLDGAGVNNINAYVKLYKEGKVKEPMPYLFIVIDEFAEFKSRFPDFGATIDSILRTGRTLGVFSILLMQKPAGVVSDQSESNVKFRWCLKVVSPSDSREMIGTTDAAQISNPGRAYVKVSNEGAQDYVYELIQSYWSGAPYNPDRKEKATVKPRISVVDISGKRIAYDVEEKTTGFKSDINEIEAIVKHIQSVAEENNVKAKQIWNEKMPSKIVLEEVRQPNFNGNGWNGSAEKLCPVVGMADDPKNQKQYPFVINFSDDGHTVLYGAPGTGKTTFLQTLVMSLCTSYKPDEVSIYIMDFGGWNMGLFKDFPHIGGIANDNESEKIEKLVRLLIRELELRKHKFAEQGVGNIQAYKDISGEKIPYIVLALDNFSPVFNLYPDIEDFFITLTREGGNYGIYFVTVTNSISGLGFKINQNIKNTMALQMSDKSDYSSIVGRTEGLEPEKTPGRGLMKGESTPLEFQTALPIKGASDGERAAKIRELATLMDEKWEGSRAKKLPIMPKIIPFGSVESKNIAIGLSSQDIETVELSLDNSHYIIISGKAQSGKSNMLKIIAKQIKDARNIVFDVNNALKSLDCENVEMYREAVNFDACIESLVPELESRRKIYQTDENAKFSPITIIIDDIKQCFDSVSNDTIKRLYAITRIGKGLNVYILAAGMADDISKLCNQGEQLTCGMVSGYHSILLGGCMNDHDVFKVSNLAFNEKSASVEEFEGYFIVKEKAIRFKEMFEK